MSHRHLTCSICYAAVVVNSGDERLDLDMLYAHEAWHRTLTNQPPRED